MSKQRVVVIGNGMVGQRFLEQLVACCQDFEITTFCEEPRPAYDRVQLTSFFAGKTAADLSLVSKGFFEKSKMTLRLNDSVLAIDAERKVVRSARYREVPYDRLVLATGSYPFVPPVSGKDRRDCFVYRTIEDLEVITATAARAKVGVVIGGGLLGLEAAKALKDLGLETTSWNSRRASCRCSSTIPPAGCCAARSRRWAPKSTCRRTRRKSSTAKRAATS